ncbi:MAG: hypothetical protein AMXMBFR53_21340 [Gemmatimonadota bacterium]
MTSTRRLAKALWDETWGSYQRDGVRADDAGVGAIMGLEVSPRAAPASGGMVHAHLLVYGHYWPQADLSERWRRLTGDSHVVDIRKVRISCRKMARLKAEGVRPTADDVLRAGVVEVLKYATKPNLDTTQDTFRAVAAVEYAFEGSRRLAAWGVFYGQVQETLEDPDYAPEVEGLTCPTCGAGAHAGAIVGPGLLKRAFDGGGAWHPATHAQPPP